MQPTDLFRQIGGELPHKLGHLLHGFKGGQQMKVAGEDSDGVQLGTRILLGTGKAPNDELVEALTGLEQKAPLARSLGNLDRGPWMG